MKLVKVTIPRSFAPGIPARRRKMWEKILTKEFNKHAEKVLRKTQERMAQEILYGK